MKILIMSDIHSAGRNAAEILKKHSDSDAVIFLGDGERGFELAMAECGLDICGNDDQKVYQVSGNCDWDSMEPSLIRPVIDGVKICITHGHGHGVKSKAGIQNLADYAAAQGCKAALFGHTHRRYHDEKNGVILFNPGAVQNGEYGIMMISDGSVEVKYLNV